MKYDQVNTSNWGGDGRGVGGDVFFSSKLPYFHEENHPVHFHCGFLLVKIPHPKLLPAVFDQSQWSVTNGA